MNGTIRVAVLGASGFSGGELIRLLHDHPRFEVTFAGAKGSVGATVGESHPHLAGLDAGDLTMAEMDPEAVAAATDLVFSALPNGTSASLAPAILDAGVPVIDLAGDFRLQDVKKFEKYYKAPHTEPELLKKFAYGIPEINRSRIKETRYVAAAGCFASAAVFSLWPLRELAAGRAIVDGKTGSSGSGIFRADTHQLFGQLSDGPSACGRETYDCFGAFAATYPQIEAFLRQGSDDSSEPNGSCAQARPVGTGTFLPC